MKVSKVMERAGVNVRTAHKQEMVDREEYRKKPVKVKSRWRFRPRSIGPFITWGVALFLMAKIVFIPLTEGVYKYFAKSGEIKELKSQYQTLKKQLGTMRKLFNHMNTNAYIEERGHQIGLIKPNEEQMIVVEPSADGTVIDKRPPKRNVEIGD